MREIVSTRELAFRIGLFVMAVLALKEGIEGLARCVG